jgi:hypothetical protein
VKPKPRRQLQHVRHHRKLRLPWRARPGRKERFLGVCLRMNRLLGEMDRSRGGWV